MEKTKKRKIAFHFSFIDFKAAFDTIWHQALWKMLRSIGIGNKTINIIEQLYDEIECAVIISGHIIDWFEIKVGVCQGCLLSPTLFNIFLESALVELYFIKHTLKLVPDMFTGTRYADDTVLIPAIFEMLKISTSELEASCKTGV